MQIVGINGFKQSGKGTTADILTDAVDAVVYQIGFADKLKIIAARSLGIDLSPQEQIAYMDEFKLDGDIWFGFAGDHDYHLSGRQFLQNLGNHARQTFGENFWIDQVLPYPVIPPWDDDEEADDHQHILDHLNMMQLEEMYPGGDIVVITDLRYPNEAERIKALGGVIWEVKRPGIESDGHASEQPLPDALVDYVILNDGDIDNLRGRVDDAITETLL